MARRKPVSKVSPEEKCGLCTASKCCTYITQSIDTPRAMRDFDHLLWQVSHDRVSIYRDEDGWFLLVDTPCLHLGPGGRCGIYAERPTICREHSNDYCEYDVPAEEGFERYFDRYEKLDAYCRRRFKSWDRRHKD